MPDLLLELGTEELPASAVRRAYHELAAKIASALVEESILPSSVAPTSLGTPRRLIVSIRGLEERQPDSVKEMRGPGIKAAYDAEGKPTGALLGFCRGQGVDPSELRQDGQYVWATKQVVGRATTEILSDVLPKAIRSLTFDKTMRWGSSKMRFARPVRWILATFEGQVVPFELEGVVSSNLSHGHRFYAPEPFEATNFEDLVGGLRKRNVEPDPIQREKMILENLPTDIDDVPEISPELVDENVFLTEWPTPISGRFTEAFLELPAPVLTTAMAKHEKMFPVRDEASHLTSKFIFVRNSGEDESVQKGCEWVLNARLNDAKFFFDEDRRSTLDDFLDKTKGIVFQEKLGTILSRSERLAALTEFIAPARDGEPNYAHQAGKYAKADLSTGLVGELTSLQGIIGGIYAKRENLPGPVCEAISHQYDLSKCPLPIGPSGRTAYGLIMADQIDKLAGYLGIGQEPSGSSDPFGLRRAIAILSEAAWNWPELLPPYQVAFEKACSLYADQGVLFDAQAAYVSFHRLFSGRYASLMPHTRHDILEGAILEQDAVAPTSPQLVKFRSELLTHLAENEAFVQTATRPLNLLASSIKKKLAFDAASVEMANLHSPTGERLYDIVSREEGRFSSAIEQRDLSTALEILLSLESPINEFFEATMVISDDESERYARLSLVDKVSALLLKGGDFTKIVFKGDA